MSFPIFPCVTSLDGEFLLDKKEILMHGNPVYIVFNYKNMLGMQGHLHRTFHHFPLPIPFFIEGDSFM